MKQTLHLGLIPLLLILCIKFNCACKYQFVTIYFLEIKLLAGVIPCLDVFLPWHKRRYLSKFSFSSSFLMHLILHFLFIHWLEQTKVIFSVCHRLPLIVLTPNDTFLTYGYYNTMRKKLRSFVLEKQKINSCSSWRWEK